MSFQISNKRLTEAYSLVEYLNGENSYVIMENKRVKLRKEDLKKLFDLIKRSPKYEGWNQLVKEVKTNNTSLKAFRSGERSTVGMVFTRLLSYLDKSQKNYFMSKAELLDLNWGTRKGGITTNSKLSQGELNKKMAKARSYIKSNNRPKTFDKFPSLENLDLCELVGALLGDGTTGKYITRGKRIRVIYLTRIVGNALKDVDYLKNLSRIVGKHFEVKPYLRVGKRNAVILSVRNKFVHEWLLTIGYPSGRKPKDFGISKQILGLPTKNINRVLRGLLDTDGHINARKDEKYKYPYVTITSYSKLLRNQIKEILRKQKFPAFIHAESVSVRGIKNIHRWFDLIGSSNPRILNKYREFYETGKIIPGS